MRRDLKGGAPIRNLRNLTHELLGDTKGGKTNSQKLPDRKDIATPAALRSDANESGIDHPAPARRGEEHILVHLGQDFRPQRDQIAIRNANTRPYRHPQPFLPQGEAAAPAEVAAGFGGGRWRRRTEHKRKAPLRLDEVDPRPASS